jgi:Transcriptional Coactivator p15 (PC4).
MDSPTHSHLSNQITSVPPSIDWSHPFNDAETRRVTVRKMRDAVFVVLREPYFDKNGGALPGQKGLCLTEEQFEAIMAMGDEIRAALSAAQ